MDKKEEKIMEESVFLKNKEAVPLKGQITWGKDKVTAVNGDNKIEVSRSYIVGKASDADPGLISENSGKVNGIEVITESGFGFRFNGVDLEMSDEEAGITAQFLSDKGDLITLFEEVVLKNIEERYPERGETENTEGKNRE